MWGCPLLGFRASLHLQYYLIIENMTIIQQPDILSLSRNLKAFLVGSDTSFSFTLCKGEEELLSQVYSPGESGVVEIDLRDIVHSRLSFDFKDFTQIYQQPDLVADFTATIDTQEVTFRVVRAGVDRLADSATNFLTQNFLTWQPTVKPVTYYSPEYLTYYAVVSGKVQLKAYFTDAAGEVTSNLTLTLTQVMTGVAYTIPMQYSVIVGKLGDKKPAYYDVWVENVSGERLTYIQRYYADNSRSLNEDWVLFENSLGGLDCFRAYGANTLNVEHIHNIAETEEESREYRVDTERKFEKNTGLLSREEARWLLDFFPSSRKYIYIGSYVRPIVVTESNVSGNLRETPASYTFTYKYADARPLLNLPRTDVPASMLGIIIPDIGNFTVPPRLSEVPRLSLSEGALFPVQNPYSETWGTTTARGIADFMAGLLSTLYGTTGGVGHTHRNYSLLELLSYVEKYLLVDGQKINAGYADKAGEVVDDVYLRKDQDDQTEHLIKFLSGLHCGEFNQGSTGVGIYQDDAGNWHIETDYLDVRLKFTAKEVEIQTVYHIAGAQVKSSANMKCVRVEELDDVYRCYMNTTDDDGNEVTNDFKAQDQAYVQTFNLVKQADGTTGNHFLWRLVVAVGENYIDLSKSVCAEGSDAPKAGDDIVQLGYRGTDDPNRQVAVIDAGAGNGAPYYRQYVGIDSFTLPAPETQLKPGDNELSGRFHIEQGSTGWKNMDGLPEEIQEAADLAADAYQEAESAKELADGAAQEAADAQDRLDGWADDGVISPTEKLTLKQELENLQAEYESTSADAAKYGLDASAYASAWNAYKTELEYHSADTPENIAVRDTFATSQAAFYEARTTLLGAIADKAKEYVDTSIGGIGVGSVNLLRNSGFTGNYETESLAPGTVLQAGTEMYSKALLHWSGIATVQEDTDAVSGRSATVGSLSQAVDALIPDEHYVLSYKAKGTSLAVACGGFSVAQPLTGSYQRYVHKFTFTGTGTFRLSGTATVCDLQLERGTIATDWKPSPLDNDKTAARFQSIQYIADAIKNGSVDILGGLILASMLQLGNYKDGEMQKVTAGVSGIYNDDDDVYTWGGGTLEQAIRAVMMFKDDPTYQPDEAELRQIAKAVITHGGRAILNDVILRGYVYALGGIFQGRVSIAGGKILLDEDGSGKLADGAYYWDEYGTPYVKRDARIIWRNPGEEGVSVIDPRAGNYIEGSTLDLSNYEFTLPAPSEDMAEEVLHVRGRVITRLGGLIRILPASTGELVIYDEETKTYQPVEYVSPQDAPIVSDITCVQTGTAYVWVADSTFVIPADPEAGGEEETTTSLTN